MIAKSKVGGNCSVMGEKFRTGASSIIRLDILTAAFLCAMSVANNIHQQIPNEKPKTT
jgi:hypothetical protein